MIGNTTIQQPSGLLERTPVSKKEDTPVERSFDSYMNEKPTSNEKSEKGKTTRFVESNKKQPIDRSVDKKNIQETATTEAKDAEANPEKKIAYKTPVEMSPILALLNGQLEKLATSMNQESLVEMITTSPLVQKVMQQDITQMMNETLPVEEQLNLLGFDASEIEDLAASMGLKLQKNMSLRDLLSRLNLNSGRIRSELGILKNQLQAGDISSYLIRAQKMSPKIVTGNMQNLTSDSKSLMDSQLAGVKGQLQNPNKTDSTALTPTQQPTKTNPTDDKQLEDAGMAAASASLSNTINNFNPSPEVSDVSDTQTTASATTPIMNNEIESRVDESSKQLIQNDLNPTGRISKEELAVIEKESLLNKPLFATKTSDQTNMVDSSKIRTTKTENLVANKTDVFAPTQAILPHLEFLNKTDTARLSDNLLKAPQTNSLQSQLLQQQILNSNPLFASAINTKIASEPTRSLEQPMFDKRFNVADDMFTEPTLDNPFDDPLIDPNTMSNSLLALDHLEDLSFNNDTLFSEDEEGFSDEGFSQFEPNANYESSFDNTFEAQLENNPMHSGFGHVASKNNVNQTQFVPVPIDLRQASPENIQKMMDQIVDRTQVSVFEGGGHAKMEITPEHLGKLSLDVEVLDNRVKVNVTVDNAEVRKLVEQNMDRLKEALASSNMRFDSLDVSVGGRDRQFYQDQNGNRQYSSNNSFFNESETNDGKSKVSQRSSARKNVYKLDNTTGQVSIKV